MSAFRVLHSNVTKHLLASTDRRIFRSDYYLGDSLLGHNSLPAVYQTGLILVLAYRPFIQKCICSSSLVGRTAWY